MAERGGVRIEGIAELSRALRQVDPELQKQLRTRFRRIAQAIRDKARARMPARSGKARTSVRAGTTSKGAYVAEGKGSVPYAAWLDFGGTLRPVGKRRNTIVRAKVSGGRFLYPALKENEAATRRDALAAVEEAKAQAGLR